MKTRVINFRRNRNRTIFKAKNYYIINLKHQMTRSFFSRAKKVKLKKLSSQYCNKIIEII